MIVPCVLAAGEARGISGLQLIEAYIVGVEVSTLFAKAISQEAQAIGLHPAGLCGTLGATTAAARIFALTGASTQTALGIAASLTAGLSQNFGTMVKPLHLGNAARNGIMAAELAEMGFTGNSTIFDQRGGFFTALSSQDTGEKLGKSFRFLAARDRVQGLSLRFTVPQRAVDGIVKIAERHLVKLGT